MQNLGDGPFDVETMERAKRELQDVGFEESEIELEESEQERYVDDGNEGVQAMKIGITIPSLLKGAKKEKVKVYKLVGWKHGWEFRRAWCYWVVSVGDGGKLVKEGVAGWFNRRWGNDVRVCGYAGGQEVTGAVRLYHVDTMEGLVALVELLGRHKER